MKILFDLFVLYVAAEIVWRKILRKGAYPSFVKWHIKCFHAFAQAFMFCIMVGAVKDFFFILYFFFGKRSLNAGGDFAAGFLGACVLACCCGFLLAGICDRLVKRQRRCLRLFFLVWPAEFFSVLGTNLNLVYAGHSRIVGNILLGILGVSFFSIVIFYSIGSVQTNLFGATDVVKS